MNILLKKLLELNGPLTPKKVNKQLEEPSVNGSYHQWAIKRYDARIESYKGMDVYHINMTGRRQMIYLHGGGYIHGLNLLHFKLLSNLAEKLDMKISILDYPLLPDHHGSEAVDLVHDYIKRHDQDFYLMGDSAGGGLALALIHLGLKPKKTVLLSPWVDVSMTNPGIEEFSKKDLLLNVESLKVLGEKWANELSVTHPLISPIYGDIAVEHLMIVAGSEEVFVPDLRKLAKQTKCLYTEFDGMFHDFALFINTGLKAADESFEMILDFLNKEYQEVIT